MANTDLIYQYPIADFKEKFEENYINNSKRSKKNHLYALASFGLSLIFFVITSLLPDTKTTSILFAFAIVLIGLGFVILSSSVKQISPHQLSIDAYENEMILTYYCSGNCFKKVLTVNYEDIISARFSDDDYTKFQIAFRATKSSHVRSYDKNNNLIANSFDCLFLFRLNPYSYEQGFFLYYANNFFNIDGIKNGKKIEKKFGTQEEYFETIES